MSKKKMPIIRSEILDRICVDFRDSIISNIDKLEVSLSELNFNNETRMIIRDPMLIVAIGIIFHSLIKKHVHKRNKIFAYLKILKELEFIMETEESLN